MSLPRRNRAPTRPSREDRHRMTRSRAPSASTSAARRSRRCGSTRDGDVLARARASTRRPTTCPALLRTMRDGRASGPRRRTSARSASARPASSRGHRASCRSPPTSRGASVDLREVLGGRSACRRVVDNDCTVAAWGEYRFGRRPRASTICCSSGSAPGSAAASCSAARSIRGAHGFAGEIGHIIVEPGGAVCGCGNRGCWETVASGSAISSAAAAERLRARRPTASSRSVAGGARRRRRRHAILDGGGPRLGRGSPGSSNVLDPEIVIVGGGASHGRGRPAARIPRARRSATRSRRRAYRPAVPIVPAALGIDSAAVGAALWALREASVKLGLFLSAFTADPRKPLAVARARRRRRLRRGVRLRPPVPARRTRAARRSSPSRCSRPRPPPTRAWGSGCSSRGRGTGPSGSSRRRRRGARAARRRRRGARARARGPIGRAEHEVAGLPYPADRASAPSCSRRPCSRLRALFGGEAWPGGSMTPALAGPLLPPGRRRGVGRGNVRAVVGVAARTADAWNGWGMTTDGFAASGGAARRWAREAGRDPEEVRPHGPGSCWSAKDAADAGLARGARVEAGGSLDIWRGTVDDLRSVRDRVSATGAAWMVPLAAGPPDRLELIAETLRS